jgi:hypothetical protein
MDCVLWHENGNDHFWASITVGGTACINCCSWGPVYELEFGCCATYTIWELVPRNYRRKYIPASVPREYNIGERIFNNQYTSQQQAFSTRRSKIWWTQNGNKREAFISCGRDKLIWRLVLSLATGVVKDPMLGGGCDLGQGALRAPIFLRREPPWRTRD